MATKDKIISMPFVDGIDTKTNEQLSDSPRAMINQIIDKDGVARKRYGFETISDDFDQSGGYSPASALRYCCSFRNELIANDGNYFYTYQKNKDRFEALSTEATPLYGIDYFTKLAPKHKLPEFHSCALTSDVAFVASSGQDGAGIYYVDNDTESIFFDLEDSTAYSANIRDVVKAAGTNIARCVTSVDTGHINLTINFYQANSDFITQAVLNTPTSSTWAYNSNSTHVYVIYHDFDDGNFKITKYAIDGTLVGSHTIGTTASYDSGKPCNIAVSANYIYPAYCKTPSDIDIYYQKLEDDFTPVTAETKLETVLAASGILNIGVGADDTDFYYVYDNSNLNEQLHVVQSDIVKYNGVFCYLVAVMQKQQDEAGLGSGSKIWNTFVRTVFGKYVAKVQTGQTYFNSLLNQTALQMPQIISERLYFSVYNNESVEITYIDNDYTDIGDSLTFNDVEIFFGSMPMVYDGKKIMSVPFNEAPIVTDSSLGVGTGSVPAGTHYYILTAYMKDRSGNIYESSVSAIKSVVVASASKVSIDARTPVSHLMESLGGSAHDQFYTRLYRSSDADSDFLLVAESRSTSNVITIEDTLSEADRLNGSPLYIEGGVLENESMPPSRGGTFHNGRVMVIDANYESVIRYSKYFAPQEGLSFPLEFQLVVEDNQARESERLTGIKSLDSKLICFKENSILAIYGEGPDNTGANGDFTEPEIISTDVGCSEPRSIVLTSAGIYFKSKKGIWLLDRSMQVSYVGAAVEEFNSEKIVGSVHLESSNEVRFLTANGPAFVHNYYYNKWTTFSNYEAVAACNWQGNFVHAKASGVIAQETAQFRDNTVFVKRTIDTGWIKAIGIQNFHRVKSISLLGEYKEDHAISLKTYHDYEQYAWKEYTLTPVDTNYNITSKPTLTQYYGKENNGVFQYDVGVTRQKGEAIRFIIEDVDTGATEEGFKLSDMTLRVAAKRGKFKNVDNKNE